VALHCLHLATFTITLHDVRCTQSCAAVLVSRCTTAACICATLCQSLSHNQQLATKKHQPRRSGWIALVLKLVLYRKHSASPRSHPDRAALPRCCCVAIALLNRNKRYSGMTQQYSNMAARQITAGQLRSQSCLLICLQKVLKWCSSKLKIFKCCSSKLTDFPTSCLLPTARPPFT
jgi:hypothetical protein